MWGGAGNFNPKAVEVFEQCTEIWKKYTTRGISHPGVYRVACTACEGHLCAYGGQDDAGHHAVLSKLNVSTLTWSLVSHQDPNGPMRKWECGLVCFRGCVLTCFGGYGIPNDPIQPGSEFVRDERYKRNKLGWTNELHAFNLRKGSYVVRHILDCLQRRSLMFIGQRIWFSPRVRGTRPPPCRNFTFTSINDWQALLYGGYLPEGKLRVSDLYLFDFSDSEIMVSYQELK